MILNSSLLTLDFDVKYKLNTLYNTNRTHCKLHLAHLYNTHSTPCTIHTSTSHLVTLIMAGRLLQLDFSPNTLSVIYSMIQIYDSVVQRI